MVPLHPEKILLPLLAYFVGGFASGYYVARFRSQIDLREKGDGTLGARNVLKVLGPYWFLAVALIDLMKGASIPLVVSTIDPTMWVVYASCATALLGHVFPMHLRFRGGKGVMPALGSLLILDPLLVVFLVALFALTLLVLRKLDLSGMIVVAFSPLISFVLGRQAPIVYLLTFFAVLLLWSHRKALKDELMHPTL